MAMVKLNKNEIEQAIWNNFGGGPGSYGWNYYLCVAEDGSRYEIHAIENWQQMECYQNRGDYIAGIPAPYGDGTSQLSDDAAEFLKDNRRLDEAKALADAEDISIVEVTERWYPEDLEYYQSESQNWFAEAFLRALNGEPNDLDIEYVWGEDEGCPHQFKWA